MNIRKAKKKDLPTVLELIKELAVFEKEPDAVEIDLETLERDGLGENALYTCFVAEVDNSIVGAALIYFRFSTWKGKILHLEDLIVKESFRGQGIGEALYKKVMHFGYEEGCKRISWEVLDWNKGAIRFYERSGARFMKDWRVVHMDEEGLHNYVHRE